MNTRALALLAEVPAALLREILELRLAQGDDPILCGIIEAMALRARAERMTVEEFDREEYARTKGDKP